MSLFDYIIICSLGPFAVLFAFRFGKSIFQFPRAKKWHACTICPPPDDAIKSAEIIKSFLMKRCVELNVDIQKSYVDEMINYGDCSQFIQLCHALGCELVIRKVCDKDIEIDPAEPKAVYGKLKRDYVRLLKERF